MQHCPVLVRGGCQALPSFSQSFRHIACRGNRGRNMGAKLFAARRFSAAATALTLIAGACVALASSTAPSRAQGAAGTCEDAAELAVMPSPIAPWKGAPLRVIFAAEKPLEGEFSLIAPDGRVAAKSNERHGGPPYFWYAEVAS